MRIHLHDLLREQAALRGDAPAVTYRDATLDYASLYDACRALAVGLIAFLMSTKPTLW